MSPIHAPSARKKPPGSPNPSTPPKLSGSLQEERRTSRARNSCSWPAAGNSQRFVSRPLPFQTPTGPPLLTTELGLDTKRNSLRLQRPRLLQPLPEVRLPTLRQCRYSQGAPHRGNVGISVSFCGVQPGNFRDRDGVCVPGNHFDLIACSCFSLPRDGEVEACPAAHHESPHHIVGSKSHSQFVARQARLRHHQFRGSGRELIAKMDGVFRQATRSTNRCNAINRIAMGSFALRFEGRGEISYRCLKCVYFEAQPLLAAPPHRSVIGDLALSAHAYQRGIGFIAFILHGLLRSRAKRLFVRILRQIARTPNHLFAVHNANQPFRLASVPGNFHSIRTHSHLPLRFPAPSSYTASPFQMRRLAPLVWPVFLFVQTNLGLEL